MTNTLHRLLSLTVLAASLAARAGTGPSATFSELEHDFGEVRRGEKVVRAFHVKNTGDALLEFRKIEFSMPGMTARVPGKLAPGAEGAVSVEWVTERVQGSVRGTATLETNDPAARAVTLTLRGKVHGPLDVEPIPAVFLSAFVKEDVRRELTLKSNQPQPVSLRIASPPTRRTLAELAAVEPGKTWRLTVRPGPDAPLGRSEEELQLASDDPAIGTVKIPVHLLVKTDLYVNPDEMDFGDVSIGQLSAQPASAQLLEQFSLVKKRKGTFGVTAVRSSVPALVPRVDPSSGKSETFRIDVGLAPAGKLAPGSLEGTITVETDDPKFRRVTIRTRGRLVE